MNLAQYRAALDTVSQGMLRTTLALVRQLFPAGADPVEARKSLMPVLLAEVRARRKETYRIATEFLRTDAARQGVSNPYIPSQSGYPEASVETVLRENLRGSDAAEQVASSLVQHVEESARRTVVRAVEDELPLSPAREPSAGILDEAPTVVDAPAESEVVSINGTPQPSSYDVARGLAPDARGETRAKSWARVLTGADNCPFCVMLASRGPVYSSAGEAGRMNAFEKWPDAKGYINSYHPNCDCLTVPIYNYGADWLGKDQWKRLEKFWEDSTKGFAGRDAMNALGRELSRMEREGEELPVENLRAA